MSILSVRAGQYFMAIPLCDLHEQRSRRHPVESRYVPVVDPIRRVG